jgi:hypothetical protein
MVTNNVKTTKNALKLYFNEKYKDDQKRIKMIFNEKYMKTTKNA